jgi:hypothetical protein
MSYAPSQEQRWDHRRDLAKHDERPGDRLTPVMSEALEIAVLVKAINPVEGAKLIEQYGKTCAAAGRLDGVTETINRIAPPVQS